MRRHNPLNILFIMLFFSASVFGENVVIDAGNVETIVIIRHAEKPKDGLGQLSVVGLKRALLLPTFFQEHFQPADYIFAPNPNAQHYENHGDQRFHCYVRPLATIEPTAIVQGLPVNTLFGLNDTRELAITLLQPQYHHATIFIAWEHAKVIEIANALIQQLGAPAITIPLWVDDDFDSVYVFTIDWTKPPKEQLTFKIISEGLNNLAAKKVDPAYLQ
jgi:hypothetical protein